MKGQEDLAEAPPPTTPAPDAENSISTKDVAKASPEKKEVAEQMDSLVPQEIPSATGNGVTT